MVHSKINHSFLKSLHNFLSFSYIEMRIVNLLLNISFNMSQQTRHLLFPCWSEVIKSMSYLLSLNLVFKNPTTNSLCSLHRSSIHSPLPIYKQGVSLSSLSLSYLYFNSVPVLDLIYLIFFSRSARLSHPLDSSRGFFYFIEGALLNASSLKQIVSSSSLSCWLWMILLSSSSL